MPSQKHTKHGPSILLGSAWSVEVWVQQCWWEFVWGIDRKEDEIFFAAYPPYTYSQSLIVQLDMVLLPRARHWTWMYFMVRNISQWEPGTALFGWNGHGVNGLWMVRILNRSIQFCRVVPICFAWPIWAPVCSVCSEAWCTVSCLPSSRTPLPGGPGKILSSGLLLVLNGLLTMLTVSKGVNKVHFLTNIVFFSFQ